MRIKALIVCFILFISNYVFAQCPTPGQNPGGSFPVCPSTTFTMDTVPICNGGEIIVPGCGPGYAAYNPYWYKFTCFQTGRLTFTITPLAPQEDYDWQLYDVTNRNPDSVLLNP